MDEKLQVDSLRREMEWRVGADYAITIRHLCIKLGYRPRRKMEQFLELHIGDLPFCVVSGTTGYYRPNAAGDINHYRKSLRSRLKCLAIRDRTVVKTALKEGFKREGKDFVDVPVQTELFNEKRPVC